MTGSEYTLLEEVSEDGRVSVALRNGDWSFSVAYAPDDDPTNAVAALTKLAEQIAHNIVNDRMTQIMLDVNRIPNPLVSLLHGHYVETRPDEARARLHADLDAKYRGAFMRKPGESDAELRQRIKGSAAKVTP
jgi:hypothetical protein